MKKGLRLDLEDEFQRKLALETSPDEEGIKTEPRPNLPLPRVFGDKP